MATVQVAGRRLRKSGLSSRIEALAWEAQTRARLLAGEVITTVAESPTRSRRQGTPQTLTALLDATYERYWSGSKSEDHALRNARTVMAILGPDHPISEIDETSVDAVISALQAKGLSGATINRKLAALGKMLSHAHERGWIPRRPRWKLQKETQGRLRWLTEAEEDNLLLHFQQTYARPAEADFLAFLVDTGLRKGEALALTWQDVGQDGCLHVLQSKTGTWKHVPLTTRAKGILDRRPSEGPKVWPDISYDGLHARWVKVRELMGLAGDQQFVIHALRHTFCSRLVQRGVAIQTVKALAGHECIQTTLRYAHLAPGNLTAAVALLERTA